MRNKILWAGALGVVAVLIAGGIFASNMGFKINLSLEGPQANTSASMLSNGTQIIALPFNQQTDLANAEDLIGDIGAASVDFVERYVSLDDATEFYTGAAGTNFLLEPGDAVYVTVLADLPYIAVGSHDPSLGINFEGPQANTSASMLSNGTNGYAYPYHSVAATAEELIGEIELFAGVPGVVDFVERYSGLNDALEFYTGAAGTNFNLVPGEGYLVTVTADVNGYVPSHY